MLGQPSRVAPRAMTRIAAFMVVVLALSSALLLCCVRRDVVLAPPHRLPDPVHLALPEPAEIGAMSDSTTEAAMRHVLFHLDDDIRLRVDRLRGRMHDQRGDRIIVLDEKSTLLLEIAYAEIALDPESLSLILNRYVFGYDGSPIRDLSVRIEGDQLVQSGIVHRIIDIPFRMRADVTATPDGRVRIHPRSMDIVGLDGLRLLDAVGRDLEYLLDLSGAKGAAVEGNDLLIDPLASLPPPLIRGRLTAVRVENGRLHQTFGAPDAPGAAPLAPPVVADNYIYFRGGSIRFGKLYTVLADLEAIDTDADDWFDFYLDYYHSQLVAGYHVTLPNYGLVTWMPDFDDLGSPKGRVSPLERR